MSGTRMSKQDSISLRHVCTAPKPRQQSHRRHHYTDSTKPVRSHPHFRLQRIQLLPCFVVPCSPQLFSKRFSEGPRVPGRQDHLHGGRGHTVAVTDILARRWPISGNFMPQRSFRYVYARAMAVHLCPYSRRLVGDPHHRKQRQEHGATAASTRTRHPHTPRRRNATAPLRVWA